MPCHPLEEKSVFHKGPRPDITPTMNILSIQSAVSYGHVGNSAAVFILQRLGHEAWPIDTVRFSNHPGHGGFRGKVTPAADLTDLIAGLDERGFLAAPTPC